mmetsp:Transcript_4317/g.13038  ORF Transcript_4317/g.13038 Transcript_4317/m.13038 type:complete len:389 (-) Transcript_4317:621-1787(-)
MAPPELSRDAPVVYLLHPPPVDLLEPLRYDADRPGLDGLQSRLCEGFRPDEPLLRHHWLNDLATPLRPRNPGDVLFGFDCDVFPLQVGPQRLSALKTIQPSVLATDLTHARVLVHNVDRFKSVRLANVVVVHIVAGSDLERAGPKLHVHVLIRDDGDPPVEDGHDTFPSHEVLETIVLRVYADCRIPENSLWAGGGDRHIRALTLCLQVSCIRDRISESVQTNLFFTGLHLEVANSCLQVRAPVDHVLPSVYESLLVQCAERLCHRVREAVVECEALTRPVAARPETTQLLRDVAPLLPFPLPDSLHKLVPSEFGPAGSFGCQGFLHLQLSGNTGVVRSGEVQRRSSLHALVSGHDVLQGAEHCVAHVEAPRDVGRRHREHERLQVRV